uniref:Reverse transcriptase domain-containing protein n=1 Tax=Poecilia mexicana TaxID=48701 RepID=A0A3B3WLD2_9TELE
SSSAYRCRSGCSGCWSFNGRTDCCGWSDGFWKESRLRWSTCRLLQTFWRLLGEDLWEVLQELAGILPSSCRQAVLSLLPKKGDLTLLKNWRPVSLLCVDYKLFSKVLSNRLRIILELIIHRDQSYCVPERSIKDNLFLLRDLFDICKLYEIDVGIISLDQEKAFDRVDHCFLFSTLRAFGFGEGFISLLGLLYNELFCVVKVGGLSRPVKVHRGVRPGCPISGQLDSIVVEPLLHKRRSSLTGLVLPGLPNNPSLIVSAYADDINILLRTRMTLFGLQHCLELYEKASSAKVNWEKSSALKVGPWKNNNLPVLPGNIHWVDQGLKFLGVHLGTEAVLTKNWEGVMERVCARLSKWKWLLPQLSYRGRVLVVNNLVASALWHKLTVLTPPSSLIQR